MNGSLACYILSLYIAACLHCGFESMHAACTDIKRFTFVTNRCIETTKKISHECVPCRTCGRAVTTAAASASAVAVATTPKSETTDKRKNNNKGQTSVAFPFTSCLLSKLNARSHTSSYFTQCKCHFLFAVIVCVSEMKEQPAEEQQKAKRQKKKKKWLLLLVQARQWRQQHWQLLCMVSLCSWPWWRLPSLLPIPTNWNGPTGDDSGDMAARINRRLHQIGGFSLCVCTLGWSQTCAICHFLAAHNNVDHNHHVDNSRIVVLNLMASFWQIFGCLFVRVVRLWFQSILLLPKILSKMPFVRWPRHTWSTPNPHHCC